MGGLRCGGGLQAHHIHGKGSHPALRYDLENGILACRNHHLYWLETAAPSELLPWLVASIGQARLDRLGLRASASRAARSRLDLAAIRLWLKQELARRAPPEPVRPERAPHFPERL